MLTIIVVLIWSEGEDSEDSGDDDAANNVYPNLDAGAACIDAELPMGEDDDDGGENNGYTEDNNVPEETEEFNTSLTKFLEAEVMNEIARGWILGNTWFTMHLNS